MLERRHLLTFLLAAAMPWPAHADPPPGKGKGHKQREAVGETPGANSGTAARLVGAAVFSAVEVSRIRSYYATQPAGRGKPLPPGIAKNLARGKPLPPGIAKRYAPSGLVRQLSGRTGYEILVAGASILLVEAASGVIRDIVENAMSR